MESYYQRQAAQLRRFQEWAAHDGTHEGPTQLRTIFQPHQMARLEWLRRHVKGRVLEVGTNMGHVLAYTTALMGPIASAHAGLDINPANVELAKVLAPDKLFYMGDVRSLPFPDKCFDTVIIAETLEHLDWPNDVCLALNECCRVAIGQVLVTMPNGEHDTDESTCFKHHFLLTEHERLALERWYPRLRFEITEKFALGVLQL